MLIFSLFLIFSITSLIFSKVSQTLFQLSIPKSISLYPINNTECEISLANNGDNNIPRCLNKSCRAFISPFVKFIEGGIY